MAGNLSYLRGLREHINGFTARAPIQPMTSQWEVTSDPCHLVRTFAFDDHRSMCVFVITVLQAQDASQHYALLEIDFPTVRAELWTHDIDQVTESDTQLARTMDSAYAETQLGGLDMDGHDVDPE